jgi:hypothetical protein
MTNPLSNDQYTSFHFNDDFYTELVSSGGKFYASMNSADKHVFDFFDVTDDSYPDSEHSSDDDRLSVGGDDDDRSPVDREDLPDYDEDRSSDDDRHLSDEDDELDVPEHEDGGGASSGDELDVPEYVNDENEYERGLAAIRADNIQHSDDDLDNASSSDVDEVIDVNEPISDLDEPTSDLDEPTSDLDEPTSDLDEPSSINAILGGYLAKLM